MNIQKATFTLLFLICIVYILIVGENIIIPLVLAALIWFLIKELRKLIQYIPFIGKRLPRWLLNFISVAFLYIALSKTVDLLVYNINNLAKNIPLYQENLNFFSVKLKAQFSIDISGVIDNFASGLDFSQYLSSLLSTLTDLLGSAFMIGLYLLFMLLEESVFAAKLLSIFSSKKEKLEIKKTMFHISESISKYISLKTFVSLCTGGLSYIALAIIGIDSPLFWAFLIFILNFIPTIGSLIATLFPSAMALLQFGDFSMFVVVLASVGTIQLIVGNIIEPKVMGNSLNVSSLIVILALSFWGAIWGITGMVLSVPITVILVILLGQFETTKKIAILMSEKGNL